MFGIDDAIFWPAVIGAGSSLIGGMQRNNAQADQASQANAFSAQQFATRYQTTVNDMQAAGLNPMLAYSQGGGSPPTGQQGQMSDVVTPAVQSGIQAYGAANAGKVASAQAANIDADTENKSAQADLWKAQASQARSSAVAADASVSQINATADKIKKEIENMPSGDVNGHSVSEWNKITLAKTVDVLESQAFQLREQGYTTEATRSQIAATVKKLLTETDLNKLDLSAADSSGNFGRKSNEYRLVIDTLKDLIPNFGRLLKKPGNVNIFQAPKN